MSEDKINKIVGLFVVVAMHGALLYAAMSYKLIPPPQEAVTLFVNLINPPPPKKEEPPPPEPPKPLPKKVELVKERPIERPQPAPVLVAEAPVTSATEPVAPPPIIVAPPELVAEAPARPAQPVMMSSELSLACPQRTSPDYPAISRRLGEQGQVKLKVELDETGHITSASVAESSGYKRLDAAGLAAVKNWRCNAATRDGHAVRAIALQPFDFILN